MNKEEIKEALRKLKQRLSVDEMDDFIREILEEVEQWK